MGKTNKQIADEIRREASNIWDGHDGEKRRIARSLQDRADEIEFGGPEGARANRPMYGDGEND